MRNHLGGLGASTSQVWEQAGEHILWQVAVDFVGAGMNSPRQNYTLHSLLEVDVLFW